MFGESSSESSRAPSPWDSLTSMPSPPKSNGVQAIPKLVPEAEEGNVEYKLQLLSPTPARFARLVTQLNWRLLEGSGKAYYELGVADSGTLVGLPRQELEDSLETLERMADEIGASVIVVKEIEVPPKLSSLAESQLERWDGRRSSRRKDLLRMVKRDAPPTPPAEHETEHSSTDITDVEESVGHPPITPLTSPFDFVPVKSSPTFFPFDPALAMFTREPAGDTVDYADNRALNGHGSTDFATELSIRLQICSVYKPRPTKKRATHFTSSPLAQLGHVKARLNNSYPLSKPTGITRHVGDSIPQDSSGSPSQPEGAKTQLRKDKRGKGQELKHNALPAHVPTYHPTKPSTISLCSADRLISSAPESLSVNIIDSLASDTSGTNVITSDEPRLIVEALVVKELPQMMCS